MSDRHEAIKPVGWGDMLARRQTEDDRLIRTYADRDGRNLKEVREFVRHVRGDIGARGVITDVGVKPGQYGTEVWAAYYIESEPDKPYVAPVLTSVTSPTSRVPGDRRANLSQPLGSQGRPATAGGLPPDSDGGQRRLRGS